MPFYIFAWAAAIIYGLYAVIAKLVGKYKLQNVAQFSFFITLFSGVVTATISIANGAQMPTNWTYIILAGLFLSLGSILYLSVLKSLDLSVMSPLFNFRTAITVILGYIFLGENLTIKSVLLIGLIIIAGIFVTMDENFSIKSFFTKKISLGLFFMLVGAIQTVFVNRAIDQTNYWTASLWMGLVAIIFSFIFLFKRFIKDVLKSKLTDYTGVAILAIFGGIGELVSNKAFAGNVGISSIIISLPLSMLLVFLFAIWKPSLLERHTMKVYAIRFIAAGVMIWGALMLTG